MRIYEDREVKYTKKALVEKKCDLCGMAASTEEDSWATSSYKIDETEVRIEVRQKDGTGYPEGGWGTEYVADICPDCFRNKLIPWIQSQGCTKERTEWDY